MQLNPIEKHKWKQRVLIVSAASPNHVAYREQQKALSKGKRGMKERDLVIYRLYDDHWVGPDGNALSASEAAIIRKSYKLLQGEFQVLLIGKDGSVKMRTTEVVESRKVFSLIDSMPMRKREMKERDGLEN